MAVSISACADSPVDPQRSTHESVLLQPRPGTGLVIESLTGATAPIVSLPLGEVVIDQAIITDLMLVEDVASGLFGLQATGVLRAHGDVLGTETVTQNFTTTLGLTSEGPGQCDVVEVDLGPIDIDRLDPIVTVDVPETNLTARGSGAVGSLLCNLSTVLNVPGRAARGLVRALNNII
jgi:hypothetical protein